MAADLINLFDFEAEASKRLDAGVLGYFAGGANDELTVRGVMKRGAWSVPPTA